MANDPFKNFKPLNAPRQNKKRSQPVGDSFVEQLKSIGSSVTKSIKNDVVKGAAQGIYEQLVGSAKTGKAPSADQEADNLKLEEWIKQREEAAAREAREQTQSEERAHFQRQRSQEKVLFSFADEKLKKEINAVRQDLAALVKNMGKVEKQIQTAVMQEVVNPGVYHKNFFENLRSWLQMMNKSMADASLWLSMSSSRKSRGVFHQNTKKHGTKYSMSHERQASMSVG